MYLFEFRFILNDLFRLDSNNNERQFEWSFVLVNNRLKRCLQRKRKNIESDIGTHYFAIRLQSFDV